MTVHVDVMDVLAVVGGVLVLRYLVPVLWGLWLLWRWGKR